MNEQDPRGQLKDLMFSVTMMALSALLIIGVPT